MGVVEIFVGRAGVAAQPVDAVRDPLKEAGFCVIAEQRRRKSSLPRLRRREISALALGDLIEAVVTWVRHSVCDIEHLI